jgi:prevent-host-death family protein
MLTPSDTWKLQDAKARFSELVRQARTGAPQRVTVHGKEAVAVVDTTRFDIVPKTTKPRTMRDFIEASKKYRLDVDIDFEQRFPTHVDPRPVFDEDGK